MFQYLLTNARCTLGKVAGKKGQGMVEYALVLVFVAAIGAYFVASGGLTTGVKGAVDGVTKLFTTK